MKPEEIFLSRLGSMQKQCTSAEDAIATAKGIDPRLFARSGPALLKSLAVLHDGLAGLHRRVKPPGAKAPASGSPLDASDWEDLGNRAKACGGLFGECLAFLQAAQSRAHRAGADLCELTDRLLDELENELEHVSWNRFTVAATSESFRDLAQIIRTRFPAAGIWDLPVAAHEFGHFMAGQLNETRPGGTHELRFQTYKANAAVPAGMSPERWQSHLEEFFADVFATYTLGPAYAFACLFLRFDPAGAYAEKDRDHPSCAQRARAILRTLRALDGEEIKRPDGGSNRLDAVVELLESSWKGVLDSSALGKALSPDQEERVDQAADELYEMLSKSQPGARFNRWRAAIDLMPALGESPSGRPQSAVPAAPAPPPRIADLLGAAWLCRVQLGGAEPDAISRRVITLCSPAPLPAS